MYGATLISSLQANQNAALNEQLLEEGSFSGGGATMQTPRVESALSHDREIYEDDPTVLSAEVRNGKKKRQKTNNRFFFFF